MSTIPTEPDCPQPVPAQQGIHTGQQPDFQGDAAGTGVLSQPSEPTAPLKFPVQDSVPNSLLNVSVLSSQARGDNLPLLGTSQGVHRMSEGLLFDLHTFEMICKHYLPTFLASS